MGNRYFPICSLALLLAWGAAPAGAQEPAGVTVKGTVQYKNSGAAPGERWLKVTKNVDICGERVRDEALLVAPGGGGLTNAVVILEGAPAPPGAPPAVISIDNHGCRFSPHVQTALRGGELLVKSSDDVMHNTHVYLEAKIDGQPVERTVLNLSLPMKGSEKKSKRPLLRPGLLKVKCDAHEWMSGYILVLDHPYAAVTDEKGTFEIKNVPPGKYRVRIWHERLGEKEKEVTAAASGPAEVNFELGK